jgi:sucrose phosphorylase
LAGENDMALLQRSGVGRDINRQHFSRAEVQARLGKPVVADLLRLIRLRNGHPAFSGRFAVLPSPEGELVLRWSTDAASVQLWVDFASRRATVNTHDAAGDTVWSFVDTDTPVAA